MQVMGSAPPVKPLFRKISVVPLTTNSPSAFTEESLYRAPNFCSKRALSTAMAEAAIVSITRNGTKRDMEVLRIGTTLLGLTLFWPGDSGLYKSAGGAATTGGKIVAKLRALDLRHRDHLRFGTGPVR